MAKYRAAGLANAGALRRIGELEFQRSGVAGHPWPGSLKTQMATAVDGALNSEVFDARVKALADPWHLSENIRIKALRG